MITSLIDESHKFYYIMINKIEKVIRCVSGDVGGSHAFADPESFVGGGPILTTLFFN